MLDLKLSATYRQKPNTTYNYNNDFHFTARETSWRTKINNFNIWLTTVDKIKYSVKRGAYETYMGRPKDDDGNKKDIFEGLV